MIKKYIILLIIIFINIEVFAQTKMEIYTNPNIVWAGILDIDIVINADTSTDWKYYEISGLGGFLKQDSKALKNNEKVLNEIIIEQANDIGIYQSDSLKYTYDYRYLDIFYEVENPEYYGYDLRTLPVSEFDVFRLRSYIYYDKSTLNFEIQPLAVAVLDSEDDTGNAISYKEIGWLPVAEWTKMMDINAKNITFAKRFYRDIAFEDVRVFKQEWTIETTMENMMESIRKQAEAIKIKEAINLDGGEIMQKENIELLGTDEIMEITFETFDYEPKYVPVLSGEDFIGVRLNLDWVWNTEKRLLHIHQEAFSPLIINTDDGENVLYYEPLFVKSL